MVVEPKESEDVKTFYRAMETGYLRFSGPELKILLSGAQSLNEHDFPLDLVNPFGEWL